MSGKTEQESEAAKRQREGTSTVETLNAELAAVKDAATAEVADLTERLSSANDLVTALTDDLASTAAKLTAAEARVTEVEKGNFALVAFNATQADTLEGREATISALQVDLAAVQNDLGGKVSSLQGRLDSCVAQLTALGAGLIDRQLVQPADADEDGFDPVAVALTVIDARAEAIDAGEKALAAAKGKASRAEKKLAIAEAERDPNAKARAVGPIDGEQSPEELLDLISAAEVAEIVASDGEKEILFIRPLRIGEGPVNTAFRIAPAGLVLDRAKWDVNSPSPGEPALALKGWGLLLDGVLVAYRPRSEGQLTMGGGQSFNLAGDVIF